MSEKITIPIIPIPSVPKIGKHSEKVIKYDSEFSEELVRNEKAFPKDKFKNGINMRR